MAKAKDINLYKVMAPAGHRALILPILLTIVVIVGLGAAIYTGVVYFSTNIAELTAERDELDRYVHSEHVTSAYQESQDYQQKASAMAQLAGGVKNTLVALSSYPDLTAESYETIIELAGWTVEITDVSYDRHTGILSFSATCTDVTSFPAFVESLRKTGLFSDVQYRGYVRSTHTEIAGQSYDESGTIAYTDYYVVEDYGYTVQCQLAKPHPHLPNVAGDDDEDEAAMAAMKDGAGEGADASGGADAAGAGEGTEAQQ